MYSTLSLLIYLACFLYYNCSAKSRWTDKGKTTRYLEQHPKLSKGIFTAIVLSCCAVLIYMDGLASGIFAIIVYLMCMLSLIVIVFPFRYLRGTHILALYVISLGFEYLIF